MIVKSPRPFLATRLVSDRADSLIETKDSGCKPDQIQNLERQSQPHDTDSPAGALVEKAAISKCLTDRAKHRGPGVPDRAIRAGRQMMIETHFGERSVM